MTTCRTSEMSTKINSAENSLGALGDVPNIWGAWYQILNCEL